MRRREITRHRSAKCVMGTDSVRGTARDALSRGRHGTSGTGAVTALLRAWARGDLEAREKLVPLVYEELRRRASAYLRRERTNHTLQPTALVHEAYLRLVRQERVSWQNRTHFFSVAAQMMRRILVDSAKGH